MVGIPVLALGRARKNKYGAVRCELDGISFDSKRERDFYAGNLKLRQMAGEIRGLVVHPVYPLKVHDILVCNYEADFTYVDVSTGKEHVIDVKGVETAVFKIKRRLFEILYPHLKVEIVS